MLPPRILMATTVFVAVVGLSFAAPAAAHTGRPKPSPTTVVLTTAVTSPSNLEVHKGHVLVADSYIDGVIGSVNADGTLTPIISPADGVTGLAVSREGTLAYSYTIARGPPAHVIASGLVIDGPGGSKVTADTFAYERSINPDHGVLYGIPNASRCVIDALWPMRIPAYFTGRDDSGARSVAAYGKDFIVADAGGNTLLRITRAGKISVLAVLPPQPLTFTAELAAKYGLPDCVVGLTYDFEPVPTDVEVGRDGYLYVTTRAGGPDGLDLGARGKVYRVNAYNGEAEELASGLAGATNLALAGGRIYVVEADAGRISVLKRGVLSAYLNLPGVVAVEAGRHGMLYASTEWTAATPDGSLLQPSVVKVGIHTGRRH
ncbi:MAG TPA: ScyD/ScyE family protein [Propionicimonas sp.]